MRQSPRSIELEEAPTFQRREWRVQRVGWWGLCLLVVAALLGLFGNGLLSDAEARNGTQSLRARYERFGRVGAVSRITLDLPRAPEGDRLLVHMNRDYFDRVRFRSVIPEPAGVDIGDEDVVFRFGTETARSSRTIVFEIEPLRAGRLRASVHANAEPPLAFRQWIYF